VRGPALSRVLTLVLVTGGAGACAPHALPAGGYCAPPVPVTAAFEEDQAPPGAGRIERLAALLGLRAALPNKASPAPSEGAPPVDSQVHVLARIETARVNVAAISAELACEEERTQQAADYLARHESDAVQQLTVASVLVAAATSVASVFLSTSGAKAAPQDAVAIGGAALTVGLGLGSLYVHPKIEFTHPRNLLADIWYGPAASTSYPPVLWAYLTRPEFSNHGTRSIRESIVARWRAFETVENDPTVVALLFGDGGKYDAATLRARSAMLGQVRAEVDLENQELALLTGELLR
jgi:hypothetical protein